MAHVQHVLLELMLPVEQQDLVVTIVLGQMNTVVQEQLLVQNVKILDMI